MRTHWFRRTSIRALLIAGLIVIVAGTALTAYVVGIVIESRLLSHDVTHVSQHVRMQFDEHFGATGASVQPGEALASFGRNLLGVPGVFRLKIFDASGRIVWSNEPKLIGKVFSDDLAVTRALRGETVAGAVKTTGAEHGDERSVRQVREVYFPVGPAGAVTGTVVAVSLDAAPVEHEIRSAQRALVGISAAAALALYALLGIAVWGASVALSRARALEQAEIDARLRLVERLRAFGEVAAAASHDLANVFGAIQGRAQLLLQSPSELPPKVTASLVSLEKAMLDGAEITHRFPQIAPRDDGKSFERVSMSVLAAEVLRMTEPRWRECAGVEVVPMLERVPPVLGRPSELREVLTNLILNGLDAMPGGGRLTVETAAEKGHVVVTVADTGKGMSEAVRRELFTPFFTTKPNGTGLGLSVSYAIVKRHAGEIQVKSEEGKGSRFIVKVPVAEAARP